MKLTESLKFWLVFSFVLIAALLGGILGNWVFIYMLDKYYGIPGGNYLANSSSQSVIVRETKKTIVEQDSKISQSVSLADKRMVKIFKKQTNSIYQPKDAVATATIMTSDGWLMMANSLTPSKNNTWEDYEAMTADRKAYVIETIKSDPISKISFVHLVDAKNLSVNSLISSQDLSTGQTLVAIGFDGSVEISRLSRDISTLYSSDTLFTKLVVSNFSGHGAYLFDANGQLAGLSYNGAILAMNGIQKTLEKLLTEGKIVYARLGVNYLDLAKVLDKEARVGALITTIDKDNLGIIPGSPAEKSGLKLGDIIAALDDTPINEFNSLTLLMQDYAPGDTVNLTVRRGAENKKISVKLDEITVK
ncbi:MAG: PDZ domain-containing protein [Candidatus Falkowbacteria bacterium]|nr:PDZ domain-containing protein [Candidatus Falkowbacteria bacterium]